MYYSAVLICIKADYDLLKVFIPYYLEILKFDKIIVVDNGSDPPLLDHRLSCDILIKYISQKRLLLHPDPELGQSNLYNKYIQRYKTMFKWIAMFDSDEFLVLKNILVLMNF